MLSGGRGVFNDKIIPFSFISFEYDPTEKEKNWWQREENK